MNGSHLRYSTALENSIKKLYTINRMTFSTHIHNSYHTSKTSTTLTKVLC